MDAAGADLNTYADALWRDAAMEAACLALQDAFGADVPLVLFALYLAARGAALDAATLREARNIAQDWTPTVVAPLRAARRALKTRDADLYARAKALEVEAERALLARLQALAGAAGRGAPCADLAVANLKSLLGDAADSAPGRALLTRWSAHASATIESRGEAGA